MDEGKFIRNSAIVAGSIILVAFLSSAFLGPQYRVWQQSLEGKAELQKAEYTRQVSVLEAQAKLDSAAKLAQAEIERAKGVAQANRIIGDSLKDNPEYLSYLWVTGLEEGAEKGNKTVYLIPSQGNIPAPIFDVTK
ncbi:membrane protease subunit [Synechococcus elongatus]|uniref:membrane protease subunit n=1 Tax=Synechococcus elongatus TaxID=32046 RepID=UPI000F7DF751|nr:membrane protease subunit [Synechococcus elongatus]